MRIKFQGKLRKKDTEIQQFDKERTEEKEKLEQEKKAVLKRISKQRKLFEK